MNIDLLKQIHDMLSSISVKGEDTVRMANCILALRQLIDAENNDNNNNVETEQEAE